MGILEEIMQMKNQGIANEEIVNSLQEQGVSPKEINDALSQAQIKSAVYDTGTPSEQDYLNQQQGNYAPQTQEIQEQETYAPSPEQYSQPQEGYQQEEYNDYAPSEGIDSNTIIEIAEQVFSEKIKKIQKQVEDISEFKTLAQTKIDNTSERLKRIETTIDKLQITILEKVGSYGKNLENIKKEMSMMQNSFGKMINPLADRAEKKITKNNLRKKISKR